MHRFALRAGLGLVLCLSASRPTQAQTLTGPPILSMEAIYGQKAFSARTFEAGTWAPSGAVVRYIDPDPTTGATDLVAYDLEAGTRSTLLDGARLREPDTGDLLTIESYAYTDDGRKALLFTDSKKVWRDSTAGFYYVYDTADQMLTPVADRGLGRQMFAKLNPAGTHVAFVRARDLWLVDLASGDEQRLTDTGSAGGVINGTTDWVYEEELGLRDGFQWSPDGRYLAFLQLDESATREFALTDYRQLYPAYTRFRYPKAGEANAEIRIGVMDMASGDFAPRFFDTDTWFEGDDETEYLALFGWTPPVDGTHRVWMVRLNRDQNDLDLLYGDPATATVATVLEESSETYLDVETGFSDLDKPILTYLDDGEHFVWRSERDGYSHLYLYRNDGALVRPLTRGDWDVTSFTGIDEAAGVAYVMGTRDSPRERHLYRVALDAEGGEPVRITERSGWHEVNPSADLTYYLDTFSNISTPPSTTLHRIDGRRVKTIEDNAGLAARVEALGLGPVEFMTVPGADGTPLEAYLIKPSDFDPAKPYRLLIKTYGGPGSQEVRNQWGLRRQAIAERLWHHLLAEEHDILVAAVDNRGTGGRGAAFRTQTYRRLGPLEAEDQIAAAQWFGAQPWVDAERIGIWGSSYGGYLTLLALLTGEGPQTFRLGVAASPITNWRFYDTIYTERYLSTPQKNPEGYDLGSPVTYAGRLGDDQHLLLIHGDADDNVHPQNTFVMVDALVEAGKLFELMIYPGEDHGIGGQAGLHKQALMTRFITENL